MDSKSYQLIGMAARARKIAVGSIAIEAIRSRKAKLAILSEDASDRTKKQVTNKCDFYGVNLVYADSREMLSNAIGKSNIVLVAILDEGLAKGIVEK